MKMKRQIQYSIFSDILFQNLTHMNKMIKKKFCQTKTKINSLYIFVDH
jgi:hypothetical protein